MCIRDSAKTVLIYAHYDVMPAEPLELWKSEPFEPEIRDGHIWARGADDDKGQSFIQVKAFEYLVKNGLLKNNVKFIFEGEEEIGSPSLEAFCEEHKELLKADVILVSDTSCLLYTSAFLSGMCPLIWQVIINTKREISLQRAESP